MNPIEVSRFCQNCGQSVDETTRHCVRCGAKLRCDQCGLPIQPQHRFCGGCGQKLDSHSLQQAPSLGHRDTPHTSNPSMAQSRTAGESLSESHAAQRLATLEELMRWPEKRKSIIDSLADMEPTKAIGERQRLIVWDALHKHLMEASDAGDAAKAERIIDQARGIPPSPVPVRSPTQVSNVVATDLILDGRLLALRDNNTNIIRVIGPRSIEAGNNRFSAADTLAGSSPLENFTIGTVPAGATTGYQAADVFVPKDPVEKGPSGAAPAKPTEAARCDQSTLQVVPPSQRFALTPATLSLAIGIGAFLLGLVLVGLIESAQGVRVRVPAASVVLLPIYIYLGGFGTALVVGVAAGILSYVLMLLTTKHKL